jgi:hypothetical protein
MKLSRYSFMLALAAIFVGTTVTGAAVVGQWPITDGAGNTVTATIGTNGTIVGNVQWGVDPQPDPKPDAFLDFGGTNGDYVMFGASDAFSPDQVTIAFWARATAWHGTEVLLSKYGDIAGAMDGSYEFAFSHAATDPAATAPGTSQLFFRVWNAAGSQVFSGYGAADPFTADEFEDGEWHHIAGTFDGSAAKLYVDGVLVDSKALSGNLRDSDAPLLLGRRDYTDAELPYNGQIGGDLLITDNALTQEEIIGFIPEPATLTLTVLGGLALLARRRRKA